MKKNIMRKAAWAMAGALMFTSVLGSSVVSQAEDEKDRHEQKEGHIKSWENL